MKIYQINRKQVLPISLEEAWDFFSSPKNLAKITPTNMGFKIQTKTGGDKMFAGQIISYKLNVLPFISTTWVTEITHVKEFEFFIDEQRFGPYAMWHHEHYFRATNDGVEMIDDVHYAIPYGIIGRLAHLLFVGQEVNRIFDYRYKVLEGYFQAKTKELA